MGAALPIEPGRSQPGSYGAHEVLDRLSIIADMLDRYVVESVAFDDPTWAEEKAMATKAWEYVHEVYQRVGGRHLDANPPALSAALARLAEAEGALERIRDYEPVEVVKDEFAYDRLLESYRAAARAGLGGTGRG